MTIYIEKLSQAARLYIKKCSHCNLKYFGRTEMEDIEKYKGSGKRWKFHLNKHNAQAIHIWNSDWYHDISITKIALHFSKENNIVESDNWANLIEEDGLNKGGMGFVAGSTAAIERGKTLSKTMNDPNWKNTTGNKTALILSEIRLDPKWKSTTGKDAIAKTKNTINSTEWLATVGAEKARKISETQLSDKWKSTKGLEKSNKIKETVNNKEWLDKIGRAHV